MQNRGAWIFGGLGLAVIALLLFWMGKTLDMKAPILVDRVPVNPTPAVRTLSPQEVAAQEEASMRTLVLGQATALSARAAAQVFPGDEASRARCVVTGATPVHRDDATAWWNAEFSCTDSRQPAALPNLTSVSVRLRRDGPRWAVEN